MAQITMEAVAHRYPANARDKGNAEREQPYALKPLNLAWEDGGAYALLGPSGCGKTTLLNLLSGLLTPSEGRIFFNQQDVTELAPQERNIAQVFQFPVIYDTMTVAENLAFPLRNRKVQKKTREKRVENIMHLLGITHLKNAKARFLGADDKQKVSLGRGLVRTDTNAILFDEPLTVIDPALKQDLRAQLKNIHRQVGQTMVYVTHDQTEALTFADKVVMMRDGEILQIGTPTELFDRPDHTFVGHFIGSPGMNFFPCVINGKIARVEQHNIPLKHAYPNQAGAVELGIRPEHIKLVPSGTQPQALATTIMKVNDLGREKIVHLLLGKLPLRAVLAEHEPIPKDAVAILDPDHIHIYRDSRRIQPNAEHNPR
ncbi:MAG: ABC transporter ATP-binding protein [Halioglobus sp.]